MSKHSGFLIGGRQVTTLEDYLWCMPDKIQAQLNSAPLSLRSNLRAYRTFMILVKISGVLLSKKNTSFTKLSKKTITTPLYFIKPS
jgi:hypothetical protein